MPIAFQVKQEEPGQYVAVYDRLVVLVFRGLPTEEGRHAFEAQMTEAIQRHKGGVGLVMIIESRAPPPAMETRKASGAFFKRISADLVGLTVIIEGAGVRQALVRSVLGGVFLLFPIGTGIEFAKQVDEGAAWL